MCTFVPQPLCPQGRRSPKFCVDDSCRNPYFCECCNNEEDHYHIPQLRSVSWLKFQNQLRKIEFQPKSKSKDYNLKSKVKYVKLLVEQCLELAQSPEKGYQLMFENRKQQIESLQTIKRMQAREFRKIEASMMGGLWRDVNRISDKYIKDLASFEKYQIDFKEVLQDIFKKLNEWRNKGLDLCMDCSSEEIQQISRDDSAYYRKRSRELEKKRDFSGCVLDSWNSQAESASLYLNLARVYAEADKKSELYMLERVLEKLQSQQKEEFSNVSMDPRYGQMLYGKGIVSQRDVYYRIASIHQQMNSLVSAKNYYLKLLDKYKYETKALKNVGLILERLGELTGAREAFVNCKDLTQERLEAKECQEYLQRIQKRIFKQSAKKHAVKIEAFSKPRDNQKQDNQQLKPQQIPTGLSAEVNTPDNVIPLLFPKADPINSNDRDQDSDSQSSGSQSLGEEEDKKLDRLLKLYNSNQCKTLIRESGKILKRRELKRHHAQIYRMRGDCYLVDKSKVSLAQHSLNKAYELDPDSPEILNSLGKFHYQQRQFDQALKYFFDAIKHDPMNAYSHYGMGDCFEAKGELELARDYFELSWNLEKDLEFKKSLDNVIQKIQRVKAGLSINEPRKKGKLATKKATEKNIQTIQI